MTETTAPRAGKAAPVLGRRSAAVNLVAQGASLGAVSVASLIVARTGGAAVLGDYALLRVLPWLTGLVLSCGLPAASTYFLGAQGRGATLRPTLAALALTGAIAGTAVWLGLVAALHRLLFLDVSEGLLISRRSHCHHPAVDRLGQGVLSGQRRHVGRQPDHRL